MDSTARHLQQAHVLSHMQELANQPTFAQRNTEQTNSGEDQKSLQSQLNNRYFWPVTQTVSQR